MSATHTVPTTSRNAHATGATGPGKPQPRHEKHDMRENKGTKKGKRAALLEFGNKTAHVFGKEYTYAQIIGRVASILSVIMYVSYIPQIAQNLAGNPANPMQPLAAFFNCTLWTCYGIMIQDKPILIANIPGIFLAATCAATAIIHF